MDWVSLAIPLIAVAVWIFSHLAGQQKEKPRPPRMPPPPRNPQDALNAQTRPEDDNKYREEMGRKREKKGPAVRSVPNLPKPRPRRNLGGSKPPPLPPMVLPSASSMPKGQTNYQSGLPSSSLVVAAVLLPEPQAIPIGKILAPVEKKKSAAVKNLLELLKNKQSLTTAFLLKEVLDLPLAKRPRRRL